MAKPARDTTSPLPPVMLVVLPPDLAQIIVNRLIDDDRALAVDLAAIRAKYEPRRHSDLRRRGSAGPSRRPLREAHVED
jgi:hypothetical protein